MKKVLSYLALVVVSIFTFCGIANAEVLSSVENTDISSGLKFIYIGRSGCIYSQLFVPGLDYLSEKYGFDYIYVDTDVDTNVESWLTKLNVNPDEFGTPTFAITENGVVKENNIGYIPEEDLFDFLQRNGMIGENEEYVTQYNDLKYIDINDYKEIIESNEKAVVVLAQYTCTACLGAKPYMNELASEMNVDINYFNLGFNTEEEYNYFYESNDFIKEGIDNNKLSTPTVLVIKGNKVIASQVGFEDKDSLKKFINDYYVKVFHLSDEAKKGILIGGLFAGMAVVIVLLIIKNGNLQAEIYKLTSELDKLNSKKEVKKEEVKEVKKEIKEEPKEEVKKEIKEEPKKEVKKVVKAEPKKEVKKVVKAEPKKEVKKATKPATKKTTKTVKKLNNIIKF